MPVSRIFGSNLRQLCERRPSIAGVARDLEISKVQFYRYLNSESFPKPQTLKNICDYFSVDARIFTEPLEDIADQSGETNWPGSSNIPQDQLPDGFFLFTAVSARFPDTVVRKLRRIRNCDGKRMMDGVHPRSVVRRWEGDENWAYNKIESQVFLLPQGFYSLLPEATTGTVSFEFWLPALNARRKLWVGMSVYATAEMASAQRAVRYILEPVENSCSARLAAGRRTGYRPLSDLAQYEKLVLVPDYPFA